MSTRAKDDNAYRRRAIRLRHRLQELVKSEPFFKDLPRLILIEFLEVDEACAILFSKLQDEPPESKAWRSYSDLLAKRNFYLEMMNATVEEEAPYAR